MISLAARYVARRTGWELQHDDTDMLKPEGVTAVLDSVLTWVLIWVLIWVRVLCFFKVCFYPTWCRKWFFLTYIVIVVETTKHNHHHWAWLDELDGMCTWRHPCTQARGRFRKTWRSSHLNFAYFVNKANKRFPTYIVCERRWKCVFTTSPHLIYLFRSTIHILNMYIRLYYHDLCVFSAAVFLSQ